jgi:hypothetical protein
MLWAKRKSWYAVEIIIMVFLSLDWGFGWTGQHPPVELENEPTERARVKLLLAWEYFFKLDRPFLTRPPPLPDPYGNWSKNPRY